MTMCGIYYDWVRFMTKEAIVLKSPGQRKDRYIMKKEINSAMHNSQITARFKELLARSEHIGRYVYSDFHSINDKAFLKAAGFSGPSDPRVKAYGGMDYAEKVIYRFGDPDEIGYEEPFPIDIILIKPESSRFGALTHPDVLGTIMGLGIERKKIGDIRLDPEGSCAVVFSTEAMTDLILNSVTMIRRMPVDLEKIEPDQIPANVRVRFDEKSIVVSSMRVDAVGAAIAHLSRSALSLAMAGKEVILNGEPVNKASSSVKKDDVLVIRGHGKFIIGEPEGETRSGKLHLMVKKFI
ncbi:MAG: YlmH/Sll1252 family protein [Lachnospiraceae bacterium]|jgi:RNA-binding protein YlmH|nr:YlmH/Sll1252 family protein [Lachnospiraceae bacterium]MEE3460299.1 YlmH/Sll1252 family protein [Lachnospiraceae bacterium]